MQHPDKSFMLMAIDKAVESASHGNYAVGAVIVLESKLLALTHTQIHELKDPTAHAEILAIRLATKRIGKRYLENAYLYTTLEPCPMCTSAAIFAKLKGIVFGATTDDANNIFKGTSVNSYSWRQIDIKSKQIIDKGIPKLELYPNFMREECLRLFSLNI